MDSQNWPFTADWALWTQPYAHACVCPGETDEVTWAGIGGYQAPDGLYQDGTRMYSNTTPVSWFEYLYYCGTNGSNNDCGPALIEGNLAPVGDTIKAEVWGDAACGNWCEHFYVEDVSKGTALISTDKSLSSAYYANETAEFVNERPTPPANLSTCPDYHYTFDGNTYCNLTNWGGSMSLEIDTDGALGWGDPTNYGPIGVEMTDDSNFYTPGCSNSNQLVSYPYGIYDYGMDNEWCRAH